MMFLDEIWCNKPRGPAHLYHRKKKKRKEKKSNKKKWRHKSLGLKFLRIVVGMAASCYDVDLIVIHDAFNSLLCIWSQLKQTEKNRNRMLRKSNDGGKIKCEQR